MGGVADQQVNQRRGIPWRRVFQLVSVLVWAVAAPSIVHSACGPVREVRSLDEVVSRVEADHLRYVFIGERHGVGPIKRFAVELANALEDRGNDVGLYVEGFRTNCRPSDTSCWTLARWFNPGAFGTLLQQARVPVHAIDPPERDERSRRMAATIASGPESVRVVLVGQSHVGFAGDALAELRVYGGAVRFPDPGDVAEAFPRPELLTIGLAAGIDAGRWTAVDSAEDRCAFDLVLTAADSPDYWARWGRSEAAGLPEPTKEPHAASSMDAEATDPTGPGSSSGSVSKLPAAGKR